MKKPIESPRYIAVLTGPRGSVKLVAKGDVQSRVEMQGQEAFIIAYKHSLKGKRPTGEPPMWDLYIRERASANV